MRRTDLQEGEEVELKRPWTDQALEDIAAFANTRGGTVLVGVEDDGSVVGVVDPEAEVQRIANTVAPAWGSLPRFPGERSRGATSSRCASSRPAG